MKVEEVISRVAELCRQHDAQKVFYMVQELKVLHWNVVILI